MLIRNPAKDDKNKIKEMYLDIFDDTLVFVDYYFESRFDEHSVLVCDNENGEIMSMLSRNARHFSLYGKNSVEKLEARYIYAVATKPAFRGKGLVKEMLKESEKLSCEENTDFEYLIPVDTKYYESSGYKLVREKHVKIYRKDGADEKTQSAILFKEIILTKDTKNLDKIIDELVQYEKKYCKNMADNGDVVLTIERDADYFYRLVKQHVAENGYIYIVKNEEEILGYAVVIKEDKPQIQFISLFKMTEEEIAQMVISYEEIEEIKYKINPVMIKPISEGAKEFFDKISPQNTITLYINEEV